MVTSYTYTMIQKDQGLPSISFLRTVQMSALRRKIGKQMFKEKVVIFFPLKQIPFSPLPVIQVLPSKIIRLIIIN